MSVKRYIETFAEVKRLRYKPKDQEVLKCVNEAIENHEWAFTQDVIDSFTDVLLPEKVRLVFAKAIKRNKIIINMIKADMKYHRPER